MDRVHQARQARDIRALRTPSVKRSAASALLDRAAFVADDEGYGGRQLRCGIRQRGMGYVMAVRASHAVSVGSGRIATAAAAARMIPAPAWHRMCTGPAG